jgi:hypothetical protein
MKCVKGIEVRGREKKARRFYGQQIQSTGRSARVLDIDIGSVRQHIAHICPLMSTTLCAWDLASSKSRPALPVKSLTCPSLSSSSSPEAYSRIKRAPCSSDSKPSSSVINRILTSGLYLCMLAMDMREKKK